jgi:putative membrane protein
MKRARLERATLARGFAPVVTSAVLMTLLAAGAQAAPEAPLERMAAGGLLAQTSPQTSPPAASPGSSATAPRKARNPDRKFAEEATQAGLAEIEAGKIAQTQASAAPVKSFAEQMVTDHTKATDQLRQIALSKGLMLSTSTDRSHARKLDKLSEFHGPEFDREYMRMMVSEHKKTVSLFEKEAKSGKDPELKNFAASLLADLQKHLHMAQSIEQEIRKSNASVDARQRPATMK